jgi:chromosome segregation ATPase
MDIELQDTKRNLSKTFKSVKSIEKDNYNLSQKNENLVENLKWVKTEKASIESAKNKLEKTIMESEKKTLKTKSQLKSKSFLDNNNKSAPSSSMLSTSLSNMSSTAPSPQSPVPSQNLSQTRKYQPSPPTPRPSLHITTQQLPLHGNPLEGPQQQQ